MEQKFYDIVEGNPVIAAIKDMDGLVECCKCEDVKVVFILFGDLCSISEIVQKVKSAEKIAMVHVDLINGLASKEVAVEFIGKNTKADGIITTKPALIRKGKELGLNTVLRYFLIDSMALETIKQSQNAKPDFIEVLPGVMPKIIREVSSTTKIPIIAGGLIKDKEDVMGALGAGAVAVSTTNPSVWNL